MALMRRGMKVDRLVRTLGAAIVVCGLGGCATTQSQPDGSTRVRLSLADALGVKAPPTNAGSVSPPAPQQSAPGPSTPLPPSIRSSTLASLFAKHPYDGTSKTYFPRVSVTVTDWSRNDCWNAVATIWWSKARSEPVAPFSVCWGQSVGFAVNNAASLHLFMQQMAVEHSGNVRTPGPKPPMLAIPDRQPFGESKQLAFQGFIEQLLLDTGWQAGAPTNLWLVGYDQNALKAAPADTPAKASNKPLDGKARALLERALSCTGIGKRFDFAESALKQAGWRPEQGVSPIALPEPLKVYGLNTTKIAISRDGGEQTYRSFLPGVNSQQVVKAASLKLGKDGKSYGRATKLGVLTLGTENGETTLTCTVDTEGAEG
ncbi:hypothetical protein ABWL39_07095 [Chitinivorax sp. PXF-14]|uniref:hypothetical protein n=1 Tax=Chitinivorax sp. PXF-14 TaxID=3230488 RepID=UPI003465962B